MYRLGDASAYASWAQEHGRLSDIDRDLIREQSAGLGDVGLSIVILKPSVGSKLLARRAIASVQAQLCPSWQLLAPAGLLDGFTDPRFVTLDDDPDPVAFYNAASARAAGEWLVVLPADSVMAEHATFELLAAAAAAPDAVLLLTDEDRIDGAGNRSLPHFKTAWDPDLTLGWNAMGNLAAFHIGEVHRLGGLRPAASLDTALYDLLLRLASSVPPSRIIHLPAILCHRTAPSGPGEVWQADASRAVVRRHLEESGIHGARVEPAPLLPACNRITYPLPDPMPLVSVIVPTRDKADLLRRCAEGVLSRTEYKNIELLIIDNDSREQATRDLLGRLGKDVRVRVLPYAGPFNYARMNNAAIRQANGEVIVLLNNDTDVIAPGWLGEMVSHAIRPEIGAVGAKLLYADDRVQHCGVTLGPDCSVIHQLRFADRADPGPAGELALVRAVSAVTGACMAFRRSVFEEVGGFNQAFKVAFNDIDLCLRIGDYGYIVICTPFAELYHLESASRGYDTTPEKQALNKQESRTFMKLWEPLMNIDPFHNPNLIFRSEETLLAAPPRRPKTWTITAA